MKPKTLYLHIGVPKTGTSVIQHFLATNRAHLAAQGYLYPYTGYRQDNCYHGYLAWSLRPTHPQYHHYQADVLWPTLQQEIADANLPHVILSAEKFWAVEDFTQLQQYTAPYHTKVIIYLRRQDVWLQSQYNQQVKGKKQRVASIEEFFAQQSKRTTFNYMDRLAPWREIFGLNNILVRLYEKQQLPQGLLADFMETVGLTLTSEYEQPSAVNVSLPSDVMEFMRLANELSPSEASHNHLRQTVDNMVEQLGGRHYFQPHHLFSPPQRRAILEQYEASNQQVAREYLGRADGRLFYDPWPDPQEAWQPPPSLSVERSSQIMVALWLNQQQQIMELQQQIQRQEQSGTIVNLAVYQRLKKSLIRLSQKRGLGWLLPMALRVKRRLWSS